MGKKSGPSPPSPAATAQAQAEANRIDQFTPFGSLIFSGDNRNVATSTLSPDQQAILDLLEQGQITLGQRAVDRAGALPFGDLDLSGLPALPADANAARAAAEDAVFGRGLRLLDPVFQQQERRLTQRLADQGIPVGSEAFAEDFRSFNTGRDQALLDLADRAVLAGGAEATRLLGDTIAARGQALTERAQPMNEILTLLGLTQVNQPSFFAPSPVDILGSESLALQGQLANQQSRNDVLGGLLGLGGTLGSAAILA